MPPDNKLPSDLDDIHFGAAIRGHQKGDHVFGRFELKKLLGRGGMGVVWLAFDLRLGREVALKFAPEAVRFDSMAIEELKEETRKGLELAHPHVVKIYDFLMDEEFAAISMEYIDGENLSVLRGRQPGKVFEVNQIVLWVEQLLDALDYAHRIARVIHRDLKPANLMIDQNGDLRITDFGIARSISDAMTRATLPGGGNSSGTLAYMSPQQADGRAPELSDDIYSVGSTLYELLTGKPPFYTGDIARQLQEASVTSLSARRAEFGMPQVTPLPRQWEETILACLEKATANRPSSAWEIKRRLGLANGAETTPAQTHHKAFATKHIPALAPVSNAPSLPQVTTLGALATAEPKGRGSGCWIGFFLVLAFAVLAAAAYWALHELPALPGYLAKYVPGFNRAGQAELPAPQDPLLGPLTTPLGEKQAPAAPAFTTIQAAIDAAKAGDTVTIPDGIYEEQLKFKNGVHLKARENGKVIVQTDGGAGPALLVENCEKGSIRGVTFQHTGSDVLEKNVWPVIIIKSSQITLEECFAQKGVGDGILVTGVGSPTLRKSVSRNNARNGMTLESGSTALLGECEIRRNGLSGVEVRFLSTSPVIENCVLAENGESGAVVKDGASLKVTSDTSSLINGEAGIVAAGDGTSLTVENCFCEDNLIGISVQKGAKGLIRGSRVVQSKEAGIHFDAPAPGSAAISNTVEGSKLDGILATGSASSALEVSGNRSTSNAGNGILIFGQGFAPVVKDNECGKNAQYGIRATEGVGGSILDNLLNGNHLGAVNRTGASPGLVVKGKGTTP